jgi:flagellin
LALNGTAITTAAAANTVIGTINAAVSKLGKAQDIVGAGENDLGYATTLANSQIANTSAAESRIRDADMAAEAANLTKAQVLSQASLAAMAQANSAPQGVLTLLKG